MKRQTFFSPVVFSGLMTLLLVLGMLLTGCATRSALVVAPPTCAEARGERYHELTDYEVARLLDEAAADSCQSCLRECWIPLMQRCLDDGRDLPHEHLVRALKVFNQQQYQRYFHLAAYRYFYDLSRGVGEYRPVDRRLLRSYCEMLIQNSRSRRDPQLARAMELCQRLDPGLYNRMFK